MDAGEAMIRLRISIMPATPERLHMISRQESDIPSDANDLLRTPLSTTFVE